MRDNSDIGKIKILMDELGNNLTQPVIIYFTGGATAVLLCYREMTLDVDIKPVPDHSEVYNKIRDLKEELNINIELAAPDNFIPELPNWKERSIFIEKIGKVDFKHYDLYSQVMAKVERGSEQDIKDAKNFVKHSVDTEKLMNFFIQIKERFIKYPAINPEELERKLIEFSSAISN